MLCSRSMYKLLAKAVVLLTLLANLSGMAVVNAQDSDQPVSQEQTTTTAAAELAKLDLTVDKTQNQQMLAADKNKDYDGLTDNEKMLRFTNSLTAYYLNNGKKNGPRWLKTTDINLVFDENHKPLYAIETIQPFGEPSLRGQLWFWQGRYARTNDDGSVANLGFGWRKVSADKTSMIGFNTFYDYGFRYNLARLGVGTEYFNNLTEYRVNWYHPLSGEKEFDAATYSWLRAVGGLDYEVGTSFKNMPWLKLFAGGYYWDNKYHANEKGWKLRSTLQFTSRLNLELGYSNSNLTHDSYVQIFYQLGDRKVASMSERGGDRAPATDVSMKLLQKVTRQNDIKTEKFSKINAATTFTVTSTHGSMLGGAVVTLVSNGVIVATGTTAVDGTVSIDTSALTTSTMQYTVQFDSISSTTATANLGANNPVQLTLPVAHNIAVLTNTSTATWLQFQNDSSFTTVRTPVGTSFWLELPSSADTFTLSASSSSVTISYGPGFVTLPASYTGAQWINRLAYSAATGITITP